MIITINNQQYKCNNTMYCNNNTHKNNNYNVNIAYCNTNTIIKPIYLFFSVRLLSVLRDHSVFSSSPHGPMTSDFEGFLSQIVSITFFVLSLFFRKT